MHKVSPERIDVADGTSNHLSSTTVIHNLMDNDATTEDEQPQVDYITKKEKNRRKNKKGPNIQDLSPSEVVELDKKLIINHRLPKAKQRTNVVVDGYVPQGRLLGAYTTRGEGIAQATYRFPLIVKAIHRLAKTRPGGGADEAYLSAQLNSAVFLPIHQDKRNYGKTWLIALGSFTGGRLWIESPVGSHPPPCAKEQWQKSLRGDYHDVSNKWLNFDPICTMQWNL